MSIAGKTVLITGSTGFFGRHIAGAYLDIGAKVVLMAGSDRIKKQTAELQNKYGKHAVDYHQADFYDLEKLREALRQVARKHTIDVLVNNAYDLSPRTGFNTTEGRLENSPYEQWKFAFQAGIYWPVLTTQIIGEQMRSRKKGVIINVSSMYGIVAPSPKLYEGKEFFNPPSYSVVKSGILALTRYTASFWAADGIRCNAIAPGAFPNIESTTANSVEEDDPFIQRLKDNTVLGRVGHPRDLIGGLMFLSTDASSYMTGQYIAIDGGWTIL